MRLISASVLTPLALLFACSKGSQPPACNALKLEWAGPIAAQFGDPQLTGSLAAPNVGGSVTLSAQLQPDPSAASCNARPATLEWTLVAPAGSNAHVGADGVFTPDVVGRYHVSVTAADRLGNHAAAQSLDVDTTSCGASRLQVSVSPASSMAQPIIAGAYDDVALSAAVTSADDTACPPRFALLAGAMVVQWSATGASVQPAQGASTTFNATSGGTFTATATATYTDASGVRTGSGSVTLQIAPIVAQQPAVSAPASATAGATVTASIVAPRPHMSYAWSIAAGTGSFLPGNTATATGTSVNLVPGPTGPVVVSAVEHAPADAVPASTAGTAQIALVPAPVTPASVTAPASVTTGVAVAASCASCNRSGFTYEWGFSPAGSAVVESGQGTGAITFHLTAAGSAACSVREVNTLQAKSAAVTASVTAYDAPVATSLTASSTSVLTGATVNLTPVFSGGTGVVDQGVGAVTSNVAKPVAVAATTTYTLTVTNPANAVATAKVTVTARNTGSATLTAVDSKSVSATTGTNWNDNTLRAYDNTAPQESLDAFVKFDVSSIPASAAVTGLVLHTAFVSASPSPQPQVVVFRAASDAWSRAAANDPYPGLAQQLLSTAATAFPGATGAQLDWTLDPSSVNWSAVLATGKLSLAIHNQLTSYSYLYQSGSDASGHPPTLDVQYARATPVTALAPTASAFMFQGQQTAFASNAGGVCTGRVALGVGDQAVCFTDAQDKLRCAGRIYSTTYGATFADAGRTGVDQILIGPTVNVANGNTSCVHQVDGTAWCMGFDNAQGQFGVGDKASRDTWVQWGGASTTGLTAIGSGAWDPICAMTGAGGVFCSGSGFGVSPVAQGTGTTHASFWVTTSGAVTIDDSTVQRAGESRTACQIKSGALVCGGATVAASNVVMGGEVQAFPDSSGAAGPPPACAAGTPPPACWLDTSGAVSCKGCGSSGATETRSYFAGHKALAIGVSFSANDLCAAMNDGSLWCLGGNTSGMLGTGTTSAVTTGTQVQAPGTVRVDCQ